MVIEKPKNVYLPYASMITSQLNEDEPPLKYFNTQSMHEFLQKAL
jgi:hypothetical protein